MPRCVVCKNPVTAGLVIENECFDSMKNRLDAYEQAERKGTIIKDFVVNSDLFGCYAKIKQSCGDMHIYKVVGGFRSNSYCKAPIAYNTEQQNYGEVVPVLNVIHCGISEEKVIRVALSDCEIIDADRPEIKATIRSLQEVE